MTDKKWNDLGYVYGGSDPNPPNEAYEPVNPSLERRMPPRMKQRGFGEDSILRDDSDYFTAGRKPGRPSDYEGELLGGTGKK